jgi:orotidine-5'-phosphate decarboxylase
MGAALTTVHAAGGRAMLRAAANAARENGECRLLAVTLLTSLDANAAADAWGLGSLDVREQVLRLAAIAHEEDAHGVVCSGQEAAAVREAEGSGFDILIPGIRLAGDDVGDQVRAVTPDTAAGAGADYIVLGRSVTGSADPREAMEHARRLAVSPTRFPSNYY